MSDLVVVGFDTVDEADKVLLKLAALRKEYLVDLEDAVVVVRDGEGKVHLKQSLNRRLSAPHRAFSRERSGAALWACSFSIRLPASPLAA